MKAVITKLRVASRDFIVFFPFPRWWLLILLLLIFLSKPSVLFDTGIRIESLMSIISIFLITVLSFLSAYFIIRKSTSKNIDKSSNGPISTKGLGKIGAVTLIGLLNALLPAVSARDLPLLSVFLSLFIPVIFVLYSRDNVLSFDQVIEGFSRLSQNFLPVAISFIVYQNVTRAVSLLISSFRPLETNLTYPKSFTGLVLDIVELGINQLALIWLCVFLYHLSLPKPPEPEPTPDT